MILHIVLFRFKAGTPEDRIADAGRALCAMRDRIPGIRRIDWGPNLAPGSAEYSHLLVVTVDDMTAVQRYLDHPHHLEIVADFLTPIREARVAADLEVPR
jgi:hypothetical protein